MTVQTFPVVPDRRRLLGFAAGAFTAATAVAVLFVLPAEYGIDPTGSGRFLGLTDIQRPREVVVETRLLAPAEVARTSPVPFRSDVVRIRVGPMRENWNGLEYKITMAAGDSLVYSWSAPGDVYYEFHGHTPENTESTEVTVMNYVQGSARESNGALTAPMDGIHGWYFQNTSFEAVEVELHLAGYYELEPGLLTIP